MKDIDIRLVLGVIIAIMIAVPWIIEWAKNPFPKAPPLVWWFLSPILCLVLAFVSVSLMGIPLWGFILVGTLAWALVQASYNVVVQHVPRIIAAWADRLEADATQKKLNTDAKYLSMKQASQVATPPTP